MFSVALVALSAVGSVSTPANSEPAPCGEGSSGCSFRVAAGASFGQGLRFNNPYRLGRSLGRAGRSLSLTPNHVEAVGRMVWPWQQGLEHGVQLGVLYALNGVSQWLAVPSYRVQFNEIGALAVAVRGALPLVLSPDFNVGAEAGVSLQIELTRRVRLEAELAGTLFVGAAVPERAYAVYPLLSLQAGLIYRFGEKP